MIKDLFVKRTVVQTALIGLVYLSTLQVSFAEPDNSTPSYPGLDKLPKYVINLGKYMGFDITQEDPTTPSSILLEPPASIIALQQKALLLFLGSLMVPTVVDPSDSSPLAQFINQSVNTIFTSNKSSQTTGAATGGQSYLADNVLTESPLIDQTPLQPNPVSQFIVNVLTTPDFSFCLTKSISCSSTGNAPLDPLSAACCGDRTTAGIGFNIIGNAPQSGDVGKMLNPSDIIELNGNTLIEPLLYSKPSDTATGTSASSNAVGLPAQSQIQAADNFIRYASEVVAPFPRTSNTVYNAIYELANPTNATTIAEINVAANARASLSTYLAQMRSFAAQSSVGVANLYSILSKRLPQTPAGPTATAPTSEALNEYRMATRRLHDPAPPSGKQWVDQINSASPASVEKEMAILLSEINYQLYLSRQQQERILLTNSIMLFQLSHMTQPPPLQPPNQ